MAATRAVDLVIIKRPQLRPLAHLALRAAVARLAAVRAVRAVVAHVARSVASSARRRRRDGTVGVVLVHAQAEREGKEEDLRDWLSPQPFVAEVQRVGRALIPKAAVEVRDQLWRARRAGWRNGDDGRWDAGGRRGDGELAVVDIEAVLAAADLRGVAAAGHVALLIAIRRGDARAADLVGAPALLPVLGAGEAVAEGDAGRRAGPVGLRGVAALDAGLESAVGDDVRVAAERHAVVVLLGFRDDGRAVVEIHVLLAAAGLVRVA